MFVAPRLSPPCPSPRVCRPHVCRPRVCHPCARHLHFRPPRSGPVVGPLSLGLGSSRRSLYINHISERKKEKKRKKNEPPGSGGVAHKPCTSRVVAIAVALSWPSIVVPAIPVAPPVVVGCVAGPQLRPSILRSHSPRAAQVQNAYGSCRASSSSSQVCGGQQHLGPSGGKNKYEGGPEGQYLEDGESVGMVLAGNVVRLVEIISGRVFRKVVPFDLFETPIQMFTKGAHDASACQHSTSPIPSSWARMVPTCTACSSSSSP